MSCSGLGTAAEVSGSSTERLGAEGMGRGEDVGMGHLLPCTQGKRKGQGGTSPTPTPLWYLCKRLALAPGNGDHHQTDLTTPFAVGGEQRQGPVSSYPEINK